MQQAQKGKLVPGPGARFRPNQYRRRCHRNGATGKSHERLLKSMREGEAAFYRFGPFRLHIPDLVLVCHGTVLPLTPKALATLLVLVRNQGRMVSKDELLQEVWTDTFVNEGILARNVCEIRKALDEDRAGGELYIETIPKRGYRFVPDVQFCEPTPKARSVAVMPFRSIGLSEQETYLGLGLADAITTRLANIRQLVVRPTSTVAKYAGGYSDSVAAGKDLAASSVLEGMLRKSGGQIRLTVQLVDVESRNTVWGGQFDEPAADLLRLESCATEQIVTALPVPVGGDEWKRLRKRHTDNLEAYHLRLKARSLFHHPPPKLLRDSMTLLQQALEKDPDYALCHSDLAYCYQFLAMYALARPIEVMAAARSSAERALQLDDSLVEARAALAFAQWHYDFQWIEAERQFQRILQSAPNDARAHLQYAMLLGETGRFAASLKEFQRASELEPNFALVHASRGLILCFARRFEETIRCCRTALRLDPQCFRAYWILGVAEIQRSSFRPAIQHLRRAAEISDDHPHALATLVHARARSGSRGAAVKVLRRLQGMANERYVPARELAVAYAGIGELDLAFDALDKAVEERSISLVLTKGDPLLDELRLDPRFGAILKRIGLNP